MSTVLSPEPCLAKRRSLPLTGSERSRLRVTRTNVCFTEGADCAYSDVVATHKMQANNRDTIRVLHPPTTCNWLQVRSLSEAANPIERNRILRPSSW